MTYNNVLEYLEQSADNYPDKIAVADEETSLSYSDLRDKVYGLAATLSALNLNRELVAVYTGRDVEAVIGMLAIASLGCAYVPLNPAVPEEKNRKILRAAVGAGLRFVIGTDPEAYAGDDLGCGYHTYAAESLMSGSRPEINVHPEDTLCVMYTSGSTGDPKGVRKCHRAVLDFTEAYVRDFGFDSEEILGNQSPFSADASAKDLYLSLRIGATLEIIPSKLFSFPAALIDYLNRKKISFISWVPSALAIVARLRTFRDVMPETLKRVYFVGEVFPSKDLQGWRDALPAVDFVNLYGSTELAGICCYYRLPQGEPAPDPLPIGRPLSNSRVWVLRDGCLCSDGAGEIAVESEALAEEYIGDSAKTEKTFREITLNGEKHRVLCTGDMAGFDENGLLVYTSRDDGMIKYKGYRIELGEIEAAVSSLDFIIRACCLYDAVRERITVFASSLSPELTLKELNAALADRLPDYMLPRRLILLDELPLNPNGKIDRAGLKARL